MRKSFPRLLLPILLVAMLAGCDHDSSRQGVDAATTGKDGWPFCRTLGEVRNGVTNGQVEFTDSVDGWGTVETYISKKNNRVYGFRCQDTRLLWGEKAISAAWPDVRRKCIERFGQPTREYDLDLGIKDKKGQSLKAVCWQYAEYVRVLRIVPIKVSFPTRRCRYVIELQHENWEIKFAD